MRRDSLEFLIIIWLVLALIWVIAVAAQPANGRGQIPECLEDQIAYRVAEGEWTCLDLDDDYSNLPYWDERFQPGLKQLQLQLRNVGE